MTVPTLRGAGILAALALFVLLDPLELWAQLPTAPPTPKPPEELQPPHPPEPLPPNLTPPGEEPPPEAPTEEPSRGPLGLLSGANKRAKPPDVWLLQVQLNQSVESNARFSTTDPEGDAPSRLRASLARGFESSKTRLDVRGETGGSIYWLLEDLTTFTYAVDADLRHQPSPRTTLAGRLAFTGDYARYLLPPTPTGIPFEGVFSRRFEGHLQLDYRTSRRAQLALELRGSHIGFDSSTLVPGWDASAGLRYSHRVSRGDSLSAYVRALANGAESNAENTGGVSVDLNGASQEAGAEASHAFGQGIHLTVRGGVARLRPISETDYGLRPTGGARITRQAGRGSIDFAYDYRLGQAFGYVRTTASHVFTLGLGYQASEPLALRFGVFTERGNDPADPTYTQASVATEVAAEYRAGENLLWRFGYAYFSQEYTASTQKAHTLLLSASWSRTLR